MGTYFYGLSRTTIDTPVGPVNTSFFIGKDTFDGLKGRALALASRVENSFETPPRYYVLGNPRGKDHRVAAQTSERDVRFGIVENRRRQVVFRDSCLDPTIVGYIVVKPSGKIVFEPRP